jgi:hypothetical protein
MEIIGDNVYYNEYSEKLLNGLTADQHEVVEGLMNNTRVTLLTESLSNTTPISSLSLPMLRKAYPRFVMPNVMPTETAQKEKFTKMFFKPYILRNGEKISLPEEFYKETHEYHTRLSVNNGPWNTDSVEYDLFQGIMASTANGDSVDRDISVDEVVMTVKDGSGNDVDINVTVTDVKMDTRTQLIFASIKGKHTDPTAPEVEDSIIVKFDLEKAKATPTSLKGLIKSVTFKGFVSSEMNNHTEEVGFDIVDKEINIPTAAHIAAPLSNEYLTSLLTMFNIDGVEKVVDIMASTMGNKVDKEGLEFVTKSANPDAPWDLTFSARPYSQYTGSPTDWRNEIKVAIDHVAQKMLNDLMIGTDGYFAIIGNPIDVKLIPDSRWIFNGREEEASGVRVDYSILQATSAFSYKIVSSPSIKPGKLRMFYIPNTQDALTYMFYPFSFFMTTANGYVNPRTPNVPSIIASRRYTYEKFISCAYAEVTIINNAGAFT